MSIAASPLYTSEGLVRAPLVHKGKVRELYDLGDHYLIVVTDRISAFDYVLRPGVPDKGRVLNELSAFWFDQTTVFQNNHVVHTDVDRLGDLVTEPDKLRGRIMVAKKAERIDIECVVRGYLTGGGWRQYRDSGQVNGHELGSGKRKNGRLEHPLFTPAAKNDIGHDEDITIDRLTELVGTELAAELEEKSVRLYQYAHDYCAGRGIILADTKFEFGILDGEIILIDELLTPDSSRFWDERSYALDIEIDSMDKEPVRTYLADSGWDKNSEPDPLPQEVVEGTSQRYKEIFRRLTAPASEALV
ncbi:phosphoribosylaminoimidazolesuccinocarboxamide synthase [Gorillibacterium sp. CAU 1737]|uniref:phosphoribosylaminoimidazolesuccinocarboxamide synthase n=1 Tax=Gorillibacterium sp. CAU 1737 TaxID=3140362 RepID=UPI003260257E